MQFVRAAPATAGIAVTIVVSLIVTLLGQEQWAALHAGFIPLRVTDPSSDDGLALLPVWLTPLSCTLVHGGLFHLVANMIMLVYTGSATEKAIGARGVVVLYLLGAFASAAAQWAIEPSSIVPMIGASGAASAIIGGYSLLYGRTRTRKIGPVPAGVVTALWLFVAWGVLNVAIGLVAAQAGYPIAVWAHIGGFAVGLVLVRLLLRWRWRGA